MIGMGLGLTVIAELLLLLGQVGTSNHTNEHLLAEVLEELNHLGVSHLRTGEKHLGDRCNWLRAGGAKRRLACPANSHEASQAKCSIKRSK